MIGQVGEALQRQKILHIQSPEAPPTLLRNRTASPPHLRCRSECCNLQAFASSHVGRHLRPTHDHYTSPNPLQYHWRCQWSFGHTREC